MREEEEWEGEKEEGVVLKYLQIVLIQTGLLTRSIFLWLAIRGDQYIQGRPLAIYLSSCFLYFSVLVSTSETVLIYLTDMETSLN